MKKFLIVGLGNIGAEYVNTRHNIGFKVLDHLAKKEGLSFQTAKLGDVAEYKIKGRILILLKPNTYMNLSGKAVHYWMEKEKITKEKDQGKLVLITSHILSELDDMVSQVIYMQDGKCCFHKSIEDIRLETKQEKLAKAIASLIAK